MEPPRKERVRVHRALRKLTMRCRSCRDKEIVAKVVLYRRLYPRMAFTYLCTFCKTRRTAML